MRHYHEHTLQELMQALKTKEISALELTTACLERIATHDSYNCFLQVCPDLALQQAHIVDHNRGCYPSANLAGVPIGLKDVILLKGVMSCAASRMLEGFVPPYDATVVTHLKEAGAILVGKLNMDEFAMGSSNENSAYGPVLNPWDPTRVPGGTSGGSAAAVAARLVPAALGTDTGGSIRQPASFCGVVGLKPTYGRVSRYGVIAYASSLDQVGALATTVTDCAILTNIICGYDANDATSAQRAHPDFTRGLNHDIKGLRIGLPREYFGAGLNPEVENAITAATKTLANLGAELVEISLPRSEYAIATYYIIAPAEAASNLSRYDGIRYPRRAHGSTDLFDLYCRSRTEGFGPEVKRRILVGTYVLSSGYYEAYYQRAQKARQLIVDDFSSVFERQCDLILAPVAPTTAFKLGEKTNDPLQMYLSDVYTVPASLAGLPGISVPCGFDSKNLPIGLQLIGKPWDEASLLNVAYAYEQENDWYQRKPAGV